MRDPKQLLNELKGRLIVSCQAYPGEELYGSEIMSRLALAAQRGGAAGIRANGPDDIAAICSTVDLPIVGLWKKTYIDSDIYITPTLEDAKRVVQSGASIVAIDATLRPRPNGEKLIDIVAELKRISPCLLMADVSTVEEGQHAAKIGFDMISTTLSGYTPYSMQGKEPDFELVETLSRGITIPVFAEGRIRTHEQAARLLEIGAFAIVIGAAITQPRMITEGFVEQLSRYNEVKQVKA